VSRRPVALLAVVLLGGPVLPLPAADAAGGWPVPANRSTPGAARSRPLPAAPPDLVASCGSADVELAWAAVDGATGYAVAVSVDGADGPYVHRATVATASWSGPLPAGTYWFTVSTALGPNWAGDRSAASGPRTIAGGSCA
jgi:hypothetical protein